MQTATAPRNLKIDGMTGDTCVQKVKTALGTVSGVTTNSVQVGSAAITCDQAQCDAASAAVSTAGFKNTLSAATNSALPKNASTANAPKAGGTNDGPHASNDRNAGGNPKQIHSAPATHGAPPEVKPAVAAPTA